MYFCKLIFFVFLPIVIFIVSFIYWGIMALVKENIGYIRTQLVATLIIVMFIAHPNILKTMLSPFACKEIDPDEYWLLENLNIQCWESDHSFFLVFFALPGLMLWGILMPALMLAMILRSRKRLNEPDIRLRFGFVLLGYKKEKFYWEFVILYKKVLFVFISVFLSSVSLGI